MVEDYRRSARPEGSNQPDYRVDPLGNRRVPVRSLAKQFSHEMQFLDAADSEDLMHAFAEKTAEDDLRGAFAKALDDTATRDSLPPTAQFPAENMARMNPDPDGGQLSAAVLHYEVHGIQGQGARGGYPGVYQSPEASEDMRSAFAKAASERLTRDPAPSVSAPRAAEGHVPDDVEGVSYDMLSGGTSPRFITLTPMEDEEGSIQFGGRTNGAAASQCGPMSLRQQNNEQQRQRYLGAGEEDEGRMHAHSQSGPTSGRPGSLDGSSGQHAAPVTVSARVGRAKNN
jgi:hypothetical protein